MSLFGFLDKVMGQIPGREERMRNKIKKLEGERDALTKNKNPFTVRDGVEYGKLSNEIEKLKSKLQNR